MTFPKAQIYITCSAKKLVSTRISGNGTVPRHRFEEHVQRQASVISMQEHQLQTLNEVHKKLQTKLYNMHSNRSNESQRSQDKRDLSACKKMLRRRQYCIKKLLHELAKIFSAVRPFRSVLLNTSNDILIETSVCDMVDAIKEQFEERCFQKAVKMLKS